MLVIDTRPSLVKLSSRIELDEVAISPTPFNSELKDTRDGDSEWTKATRPRPCTANTFDSNMIVLGGKSIGL